jgi:hypothetical protein
VLAKLSSQQLTHGRDNTLKISTWGIEVWRKEDEK